MHLPSATIYMKCQILFFFISFYFLFIFFLKIRKLFQSGISFCLVCKLTLVLLNPDIPWFCKQCRSRSVVFFRSQLIWICTVCHSVCEFISTIWIKAFDWLTIRSGRGTLIYSAGQGLSVVHCQRSWLSYFAQLVHYQKLINFYK